MLNRLLPLTASLLAATCTYGQQAVETFNYDSGDLLGQLPMDGGEGWSGAWTILKGDDYGVVAEGGITSAALSLQTDGSRLTFDHAGGDASGVRYYRQLATPSADVAGDEVWMSFFQETTIDGDPSMNGSVNFVGFANSAEYMEGGPGGQLMFVGRQFGNENIAAVRIPQNAAFSEESATEASFIVTAMYYQGAGEPEDIYVWVDPDPAATTLDTATADIKRYDLSLDDGFDAIGGKMEGGGALSGMVDEIRLGASYADVVSPDLTEGEPQTGGSLSAVEQFGYEVGAALPGQSGGDGWGSDWTAGAGTDRDSSEILADGLVLEGLGVRSAAPSVAIRSTGAGQRHQRLFASPITTDTEEFWFAYQLGVSGSLQGNVANLTLVNLDTAGGQAFERVFLGKPFGGGGIIAGGPKLVGGNKDAGAQLAENGTGSWIVSRMSLTDVDSSEWTLTTWIDPAPGATPADADANVSDARVREAQFDGIWLKVEGGQGLDATFDDVLFGGDFAAITPDGLEEVDIEVVEEPVAAFEPFAYDAGSALAGLDGGEGFASAWTTDGGGDFAVAEQAIESPRTDESGGQLVLDFEGDGDALATASRDLFAAYGQEADESVEVWVSFLLEQPVKGAGNSGYVSFRDSLGTEAVRIGTTGGSTGLAVSVDGAAPVPVANTDATAANWIVARFDLDGTAGPDAVRVWLNPAADALPADENADFASDNVTGLNAGLSAVGLGAAGLGTIQVVFDEFRVGDGYREVSEGFGSDNADLIAYEPFNYDAGVNLVGAGGVNSFWNGPWEASRTSSANNPSVIVDADIAGVSPEPIGNQVRFDLNDPVADNGARRVRPFAVPVVVEDSSEYWVSFYMNTPAENANVFGNVSLMILTSPDPRYPDRQAIGFGRGFEESSGPLSIVFPGAGKAVSRDVNDIDDGLNFIVAKITSTPDDEDGDLFAMWVNPPTDVEPDTATAAVINTRPRLRGVTLDGVMLKVESNGNDPGYATSFDELRVATNFTSAVGLISNTVEAAADDVLGVTAAPNPVRDRLTINWHSEVGGPSAVRILNQAGQVVHTVAEGFRGVGEQQAVWNAGAGTPNGFYYLQVVQGEYSSVRKLILYR